MDELLERTAALVDIASVSQDEAAICDALEQELRGHDHLEVTRIENNLVCRTHLGRAARLVLAGHLDTVPPAGNAGAMLDGDRCFGLGSADMKGGLAVMASLAGAAREPSCDLSYVFYACEEISRVHSGLLAIERADPELLTGDAALVLEPTSAAIEAGCQGVIRVRLRIGGRRAHSARPWTGVNAIHRSAALLSLLASYRERRVVLDDCEYRESLQAVRIDGGVAGNVVPDAVNLIVSHRFAPDRDANQAYRALVEYLSPVLDEDAGDEVALEDSSPAAPPSLSSPFLAQLIELSGLPPSAKLGWTDVAFFYERSIPAANFGPGDGLLAHTPDEFVTAADLTAVRASLAALVGAS